jgi:hypothetical protein
MSYADENKDIYINIYGRMFNDDDRKLTTPNYNNINSLFYSSTKYHHTIKQKPAEKVVEICVLVSKWHK